MKNNFILVSDASAVAKDKNTQWVFGMGIVILSPSWQIQKILSTGLRPNDDIQINGATTHEFYAALHALKSVPRGSDIVLYVDNTTVQKGVKGSFTPNAYGKFQDDFENVLMEIRDAVQNHNSVDVRYAHNEPNLEPLKCAMAIAHNASALVTGARKRQRTYPLLTDGPFSSHANETKRKTRSLTMV